MGFKVYAVPGFEAESSDEEDAEETFRSPG